MANSAFLAHVVRNLSATLLHRFELFGCAERRQSGAGRRETLGLGDLQSLEPRILLATQPLAFGAMAAGMLANPGEELIYDLPIGIAELDKRFSVTVDGDGTLHPVLQLIGPSGQAVSSAPSGNSIWDSRIVDLTARAVANGGEGPGTYRVRVAQVGSSTGAFEVGVSDRPVEPARTIGFSQWVSDRIDFTGDEDVYTFNAQAGDAVTLSLDTTGFNGEMVVNGPESFTAATTSSQSQLGLTLPTAGQYAVTVRARGSGGIGHGMYLLSLSDPRPAAQPIQPGQALPGRVKVPGDFAVYTLDLDPSLVNKPVSITATRTQGDSNFTTRLQLLEPSQQVVKTLTGWGPGNALEIDDFVPSVAGSYTIRVSEVGNNEVASFAVAVSDQPTEAVKSLPAFNAPVSGSFERLGDVDEYAFQITPQMLTGASGSVLTIQRLSSTAELTLLGPDGSVAAVNDASGLINLLSIGEAGEYRLRVEPGGGSVSGTLDYVGSYGFAVWTPVRRPEVVGIGFGQSVAGELKVRGDVLEYGLEVGPQQVGRPVSVVVSTTSGDGSFATKLELLDPSGAVAGSVGTSWGPGNAVEMDDYVLGEAGLWRIRVSEQQNDEVASFTVAVSDQPVETAKALTLVVDGALRQVSSHTKPTKPAEQVRAREELGSHIGWIIAHELAHNLGLLDEYVNTAGGGSTALVNPPTFMSTNGVRRVSMIEDRLFALAFDDPNALALTNLSAADVRELVEFVLTIERDKTWARPANAPRGDDAASGASGLDISEVVEPVRAAIRIPSASGTGPSPTQAASANSTLLNGTFDSLEGWQTRGNVSVGDGKATLGEHPQFQTGLWQTMVVPAGAKLLHFTLLGVNLGMSDLAPDDAFEAALLDAASMASLAGTAGGLAGTDAFFNLQADHRAFFSSKVFFRNAINSGEALDTSAPVDVYVDVSEIPAGAEATLYFDLLGLGTADSTVIVDNVEFRDTPIFNVAPVVDAGSAGTITRGVAFTRLGAFADPDLGDHWTAMVNWGDGSGDQPLALNDDKTFSLNRIYAGDGEYDVVVKISDAAGATGAATFRVRVLAKAQVTETIINGGHAQRSMLTRTAVVFDRKVMPQEGAFEVVGGAGVHVSPNVVASEDGRRFELTFSGAGIIGSSLADGDYQLERVLNFEAAGAVELLWQGSPTPAMSRMRSGRLWRRT